MHANEPDDATQDFEAQLAESAWGPVFENALPEEDEGSWIRVAIRKKLQRVEEQGVLPI